MNVEKLIDELIEREGGYVNHTGANMGPAVAATFLQRALTRSIAAARITPTWCLTGGLVRPRSRRWTPFSRHAGKEAARRCFCARWKPFKASATSAWPRCGRPTKPSSMADLRTVLVICKR